MKLNILTWNTGITEWKKYDDDKCDKIFNFIKNFLQQENSVAFLQQMPYKIKNQGEWVESDFYGNIKNKINEYEMLFNKEWNKGYIYMATMVVIRNNENFTELDETFYTPGGKRNREYAIEYNGITFLGLHAENGDENRKYLSSLNGKADIILGDFNAGDYPECENRHIFCDILKEHICICNIPTREDPKSHKKTCIDHIFVRDNYISKCSNVIVHYKLGELSDHLPVSFSLEL